MARSTETRAILGFPIIVTNTRPDIDTTAVLQRLTEALQLIAAYDAPRFHRLQHDLEQIWVRRYPCRAAYFPQARACMIELTFLGLGQFTPAQIASSIVHEGVHARLHHMGVGGRAEWRAREERLCRTAELEFGLVIPDGDAVVARARESLTLTDHDVAPSIDWHEAKRRIAIADGVTAPTSVLTSLTSTPTSVSASASPLSWWSRLFGRLRS